MRKLSIVLGLVMLAVAVMAGAPTHVHYYDEIGAVTANNDFTGTWDSVAARIIDPSDTACIVFTLSGVALMTSGDRLYLGIGNNAAAHASATLDTIMIQAPRMTSGYARVPFSAQIVHTNLGAADTFFVCVACGGSSSVNYVDIEDMVLQSAIMDEN